MSFLCFFPFFLFFFISWSLLVILYWGGGFYISPLGFFSSPAQIFAFVLWSMSLGFFWSLCIWINKKINKKMLYVLQIQKVHLLSRVQSGRIKEKKRQVGCWVHRYWQCSASGDKKYFLSAPGKSTFTRSSRLHSEETERETQTQLPVLTQTLLNRFW